MACHNNLVALHGKMALGEMPTQEAIAWAVDEIVAGRHTPELCVLAGMPHNTTWSEFQEQWARVEAERGQLRPDIASALLAYARQIANCLLNGDIEPLAACDRIRAMRHDLPDAWPFAQLYWAWCDLLEANVQHYVDGVTRDNWEQAVRQAAGRLVEQTGTSKQSPVRASLLL